MELEKNDARLLDLAAELAEQLRAVNQDMMEETEAGDPFVMTDPSAEVSKDVLMKSAEKLRKEVEELERRLEATRSRTTHLGDVESFYQHLLQLSNFNFRKEVFGEVGSTSSSTTGTFLQDEENVPIEKQEEFAGMKISKATHYLDTSTGERNRRHEILASCENIPFKLTFLVKESDFTISRLQVFVPPYVSAEISEALIAFQKTNSVLHVFRSIRQFCILSTHRSSIWRDLKQQYSESISFIEPLDHAQSIIIGSNRNVQLIIRWKIHVNPHTAYTDSSLQLCPLPSNQSTPELSYQFLTLVENVGITLAIHSIVRVFLG